MTQIAVVDSIEALLSHGLMSLGSRSSGRSTSIESVDHQASTLVRCSWSAAPVTEGGKWIDVMAMPQG